MQDSVNDDKMFIFKQTPPYIGYEACFYKKRLPWQHQTTDNTNKSVRGSLFETCQKCSQAPSAVFVNPERGEQEVNQCRSCGGDGVSITLLSLLTDMH